MSEKPDDGGVITGILTGALLGLTVAMALSPVKSGSKRASGALYERGRAVLDAASAGLGSSAGGSDPTPSPSEA